MQIFSEKSNRKIKNGKYILHFYPHTLHPTSGAFPPKRVYLGLCSFLVDTIEQRQKKTASPFSQRGIA